MLEEATIIFSDVPEINQDGFSNIVKLKNLSDINLFVGRTNNILGKLNNNIKKLNEQGNLKYKSNEPNRFIIINKSRLCDLYYKDIERYCRGSLDRAVQKGYQDFDFTHNYEYISKLIDLYQKEYSFLVNPISLYREVYKVIDNNIYYKVVHYTTEELIYAINNNAEFR